MFFVGSIVPNEKCVASRLGFKSRKNSANQIYPLKRIACKTVRLVGPLNPLAGSNEAENRRHNRAALFSTGQTNLL